MTYLIAGVLLWSTVHLAPAVPFGIRARLDKAMGTMAYKGLFALLIIGSVVLMVAGWKTAPREMLFMPPAWGSGFNLVCMLAASILFPGPYIKSNVHRFVRHPQLTGLVLWGIGHVLATGQTRSVILFGGLAAWALIEMLFINRRDGARERPARVGAKADFQLLMAGVLLFVVLMYTHGWLFGVSLGPAW